MTRTALETVLSFLGQTHVWLTLVVAVVVFGGYVSGAEVVGLFKDVLQAVVSLRPSIPEVAP